MEYLTFVFKPVLPPCDILFVEEMRFVRWAPPPEYASSDVFIKRIAEFDGGSLRACRCPAPQIW